MINSLQSVFAHCISTVFLVPVKAEHWYANYIIMHLCVCDIISRDLLILFLGRQITTVYGQWISKNITTNNQGFNVLGSDDVAWFDAFRGV